MKSKFAPIAITLAAIFAGLAVASVWWGPRPVTLQSGSLLTPPRPLPDFAPLTADDGQPFTRASLDGHWTLLFPGYTYCPDVCPTTLAMLNALATAQAKTGQPVQVIFLSVDPARDTPERLRVYVHAFNPQFTGVTAQEPTLAAFAKIFGIAYAKADGGTPDHYTMDHTTTLILIDSQARIAAYFTPPFQLQTLQADLRAVLSGR